MSLKKSRIWNQHSNPFMTFITHHGRWFKKMASMPHRQRGFQETLWEVGSWGIQTHVHLFWQSLSVWLPGMDDLGVLVESHLFPHLRKHLFLQWCVVAWNRSQNRVQIKILESVFLPDIQFYEQLWACALALVPLQTSRAHSLCRTPGFWNCHPETDRSDFLLLSFRPFWRGSLFSQISSNGNHQACNGNHHGGDGALHS